MNPNINLHIDSIVLDGIDLAPGDDRLLPQIVSRELSILLSREGLGTSQRSAGEFGSISGGTIRLGATGTTSLGQQLAHSIHQGVAVGNSPSAASTGGLK